MPLSKRVRIEVFVPDLPSPVYQRVLRELIDELTYTFGGCTLISSKGQYLSNHGMLIPDPIQILFTDTPFHFEQDRKALDRYLLELQDAVARALAEEEAVLVTLHPIYHAK